MESAHPGFRALGALVLYLVVAAAVANLGPYAAVRSAGGRLGPPDERPRISPAAISIFLGRLGPDGRDAYRRAVLLDFIAPALFVCAGWCIVHWARLRAPHLTWGPSLILKLLVLVAGAESSENLLLLSALRNYPGRPPLGDLIGLVVGVKYALFALSVVSLVGLTLIAWMDGVRTPRLDP